MFDITAMKGMVLVYIALAIGGGLWIALILAFLPAVKGWFSSFSEMMRR